MIWRAAAPSLLLLQSLLSVLAAQAARSLLSLLMPLLMPLLLLVTMAGTAWAQTSTASGLVPIPPLNARVTDLTGTLSAAELAALESKLAAFEAEAGPQIVVLMLSATAPEDITDYTQRLGDAWKLGRRDVGDGLLLVVAKDERKLRIAPAKALEGAVPDLAARQIIDRQIGPAFRGGDYAGGLNAGVDALIVRIRGENLPTPDQDSRAAGTGFQLEELMLFFFIAVPVLGSVLTGIFGRKLGSALTAGASGGIGWWISASLLIALGAGAVALFVVGLLGVGSGGGRGGGGGGGGGGLGGLNRGRNLPHIGGWGGGWGGGGFGGGGGRGGGGFSSGGGGSFGGGGSSGGW